MIKLKELREIEKRLDCIDKKLAVIDERLNNHLAHHEGKEKWLMWIVPILLTLLNLALAYFNFAGAA